MNNVQLIGRATKGKDELDEMFAKNGNAGVRFSIATERKHKAEGQANADFVPVVAWGKTAEVIKKYMEKGHKYAITGRIQTGSYKNKDGKTIPTFAVVAESFEFVESKGSKAEPIEDDAPVRQEAPVFQQSSIIDVPEEIDLELPFN